ncbi:hypothetical protein D3C87_1966220 [compost metagenome]
MRFHGPLAEADFGGDSGIGLALGNKGQDLALPPGYGRLTDRPAHRLEAVERFGEGVGAMA